MSQVTALQTAKAIQHISSAQADQNVTYLNVVFVIKSLTIMMVR